MNIISIYITSYYSQVLVKLKKTISLLQLIVETIGKIVKSIAREVETNVAFPYTNSALTKDDPISLDLMNPIPSKCALKLSSFCIPLEVTILQLSDELVASVHMKTDSPEVYDNCT